MVHKRHNNNDANGAGGVLVSTNGYSPAPWMGCCGIDNQELSGIGCGKESYRNSLSKKGSTKLNLF
jgi:hypothetical protein